MELESSNFSIAVGNCSLPSNFQRSGEKEKDKKGGGGREEAIYHSQLPYLE